MFYTSVLLFSLCRQAYFSIGLCSSAANVNSKTTNGCRLTEMNSREYLEQHAATFFS